jgi:hypothetical protein
MVCRRHDGWEVDVVRRLAAIVVGAATVLALAGCVGPAAGAPLPTPSQEPLPSPVRQPAEYSGGACQLLNYDQISAAIGVQFDVAAASSTGDTFTCVLQRVDADLPDLSLAVSPTLADPTVFKSSVAPKGATVRTDLGKVGYTAAVPGAAGGGPGIEVGWLSGNQRLMVLRFRTPAGTAPGDAAAMTPKLVTLAQKVDQASV